uniref:Uncharacterized protein n=1 Tax=Romanomermis culicivorax TaxID=13658 RepID=A0A915J2T4_ROMCU
MKREPKRMRADMRYTHQIYAQSMVQPAEQYSEERNQILDHSPVGHLPRSHERMGLLDFVSDNQQQQNFERSAQKNEMENRRRTKTSDSSIDEEKFCQNFSQSIEYSPESSPMDKKNDDAVDSDAG